MLSWGWSGHRDDKSNCISKMQKGGTRSDSQRLQQGKYQLDIRRTFWKKGGYGLEQAQAYALL